ncbi:M14 family metallocarboxypeptidase [Alkalibacillus sp. S2W]|uniref:M14 family metallopeptidase n=1 Tax=Alkalibacillus sp. S2W TaxID=3386553 RepID=UPI00398CB698
MRARQLIQDQSLYTYAKFEHDLMALKAEHPIFSIDKIGTSIQGKAIYEIVIGDGDKSIHLNGSMHAHESITTNVLMRFLADYIDAYENNESINHIDARSMYNQIKFSIVPLVNPDGVDLINQGLPQSKSLKNDVLAINQQSHHFAGWKANIRGVDLNNQFPAHWEIEQQRNPKQPSPRDFPGFQPLTEPEAIAIYELTSNKQFDRVLAFHTQGEVIYWGYEGLEPPQSNQIADVYGDVSGYQPIRYVDSHAGYKDWFIQTYQKPGFTVELGSGVNPLPISDLNQLYPQALSIILANMEV